MKPREKPNKPTQPAAFSLAGVTAFRIIASSMRRWLVASNVRCLSEADHDELTFVRLLIALRRLLGIFSQLALCAITRPSSSSKKTGFYDLVFR